jgi:hypothetical protein
MSVTGATYSNASPRRSSPLGGCGDFESTTVPPPSFRQLSGLRCGSSKPGSFKTSHALFSPRVGASREAACPSERTSPALRRRGFSQGFLVS